jgi:hypothetical protein
LSHEIGSDTEAPEFHIPIQGMIGPSAALPRSGVVADSDSARKAASINALAKLCTLDMPITAEESS